MRAQASWNQARFQDVINDICGNRPNYEDIHACLRHAQLCVRLLDTDPDFGKGAAKVCSECSYQTSQPDECLSAYAFRQLRAREVAHVRGIIAHAAVQDLDAAVKLQPSFVHLHQETSRCILDLAGQLSDFPLFQYYVSSLASNLKSPPPLFAPRKHISSDRAFALSRAPVFDAHSSIEDISTFLAQAGAEKQAQKCKTKEELLDLARRNLGAWQVRRILAAASLSYSPKAVKYDMACTAVFYASNWMNINQHTFSKDRKELLRLVGVVGVQTAARLPFAAAQPHARCIHKSATTHAGAPGQAVR